MSALFRHIPRKGSGDVVTATRTRIIDDSDTLLDAYYRRIMETPLLNAEEERALAIRIREGDRDAFDAMLKANLRLVVFIARRYGDNYGLPFPDIISEGNLGLMDAIPKYDGVRSRFATYASYWIHQRIRRANALYSKTIRIPMPMVERISKVRKAQRKLYNELDREPLPEEIADELNISVEKVTLALSALHTYISLDSPLDGNHPHSLIADVIPDPRAASADQEVELSDLRERLDVYMSCLNSRERDVLTRRYMGEETQEAIANDYDLTRERIRQIETVALRKVRANALRLEPNKTPEQHQLLAELETDRRNGRSTKQVAELK